MGGWVFLDEIKNDHCVCCCCWQYYNVMLSNFYFVLSCIYRICMKSGGGGGAGFIPLSGLPFELCGIFRDFYPPTQATWIRDVWTIIRLLWFHICLYHFPSYWVFRDSSVGKESACNAGDPSSIPGSGRSAGEGIGYPLQYSWVSLVTQLVICLQCGRPGFSPWVGKIPWRGERLRTPEFCPGEFHGLYSLWGRKESDVAVRHSWFSQNWGTVVCCWSCSQHRSPRCVPLCTLLTGPRLGTAQGERLKEAAELQEPPACLFSSCSHGVTSQSTASPGWHSGRATAFSSWLTPETQWWSGSNPLLFRWVHRYVQHTTRDPAGASRWACAVL